jgi:hypothetical protein
MKQYRKLRSVPLQKRTVANNMSVAEPGGRVRLFGGYLESPRSERPDGGEQEREMQMAKRLFRHCQAISSLALGRMKVASTSSTTGRPSSLGALMPRMSSLVSGATPKRLA